jgi:hypothetical protein
MSQNRIDWEIERNQTKAMINEYKNHKKEENRMIQHRN